MVWCVSVGIPWGAVNDDNCDDDDIDGDGGDGDDDGDDDDDEEWSGASVGIPWGAVKPDKTLANFVNFQQTLIEGWMATMMMMMTRWVVVLTMMSMRLLIANAVPCHS